MDRCPITYNETKARYSKSGLYKLSPKLRDLKDLPFTAQEQRMEAAARSGKMSIQGVQPKLSATLSVKSQQLNIVEQGGIYIIKPQSELFTQLPENEDLTMKMAALFDIEVPFTGLVYSKDDSLSYLVKRFDRFAKNKKLPLEDFAQLTENTRDTKYNWSMEKLLPVIDNFCTFPLLEKRKLFRRVLFSFITGNEDMHLKNFSLITRKNKVELSPAYDLLNSTISMGGVIEEMALPLNGKKRNLTRELIFDYYGKEKMELNEKILETEALNVINNKERAIALIGRSFLSMEMQLKYLDLFNERISTLKLD